MFEVTTGRQRRYAYFGLFVVAALSLLPWTEFILEMLGPFAFIGVLLMIVIVLGGYGILKEWRVSRILSIVGPALTTALFLFISAGLLLERTGSQPPLDLVLIVGLPLILNLTCLLVAVFYCSRFYQGQER